MGKHGASKRASSVALLTEGVDRNSIAVARRITLRVALLTEGVDRNLMKKKNWKPVTWSPSSRRAWIEILWGAPLTPLYSVALLAEGVDRNKQFIPSPTDDDGRPPRGGRG